MSNAIILQAGEIVGYILQEVIGQVERKAGLWLALYDVFDDRISKSIMAWRDESMNNEGMNYVLLFHFI